MLTKLLGLLAAGVITAGMLSASAPLMELGIVGCCLALALPYARRRA